MDSSPSLYSLPIFMHYSPRIFKPLKSILHNQKFSIIEEWILPASHCNDELQTPRSSSPFLWCCFDFFPTFFFINASAFIGQLFSEKPISWLPFFSFLFFLNYLPVPNKRNLYKTFPKKFTNGSYLGNFQSKVKKFFSPNQLRVCLKQNYQ